jgi:hypothetical protein
MGVLQGYVTLQTEALLRGIETKKNGQKSLNFTKIMKISVFCACFCEFLGFYEIFVVFYLL